MKRKLLALVLTLTLTLGLSTPALAAQGSDVAALFPAVDPYPGYADVPDGDWFAPAVQVCVETRMMNGVGAGAFSPHGTVSVAQAITLAVRIRDILQGGDGVIESPAGAPWYAGAVTLGRQLAQAAGDNRLLSRLSFPDDDVTRADFFRFIALAVGEQLLTPVNTVSTLPDTTDETILRFYNAGILRGTDDYGSFLGARTLERCEAAVMVARILRPALREVFTLTPVPALCLAAGVLPETEFFPGVTALTYLTQAAGLIAQLENACDAQGIPFDWGNTVNGQSFSTYVREQALAALSADAASATQAYRDFDLQVFYSRYLDLTGQVSA